MTRDCSKVEAEYERRQKMTLDINEHLGVLFELSSRVSHVTEFGVREGHSTIALAAGMPMWFHSYDIAQPGQDLIDLISECVPNYQFHLESTLEAEIEPTQFLFIDSYHTYSHLKQELSLHAGKAQYYIGLHDTETFGLVDQDGSKPGLTTAIDEFLAVHPEWGVLLCRSNNNGLTILEKQPCV